jgi:hypothetical protein
MRGSSRAGSATRLRLRALAVRGRTKGEAGAGDGDAHGEDLGVRRALEHGELELERPAELLGRVVFRKFLFWAWCGILDDRSLERIENALGRRVVGVVAATRRGLVGTFEVVKDELRTRRSRLWARYWPTLSVLCPPHAVQLQGLESPVLV